ncbi:MAG TPA: acylphosphatase [Pseudothermotoga sp.]|nr:acylphosphatase [Pseudothermotoga sp.]HOK83109.1 acylphosphatase [Pseudothermotoga sp.]HPP69720.1 acylphosphatase [Pseudothermotoga sp.]
MPAFFIKIYGHVQGVGFRYFTYRIARKMGIKGYVRNAEDGSVEIHAEGDEKSLGDFLNQVSRGPISAVVTNVEYEQVDEKDFQTFEISD